MDECVERPWHLGIWACKDEPGGITRGECSSLTGANTAMLVCFEGRLSGEESRIRANDPGRESPESRAQE